MRKDKWNMRQSPSRITSGTMTTGVTQSYTNLTKGFFITNRKPFSVTYPYNTDSGNPSKASYELGFPGSIRPGHSEFHLSSWHTVMGLSKTWVWPPVSWDTLMVSLLCCVVKTLKPCQWVLRCPASMNFPAPSITRANSGSQGRSEKELVALVKLPTNQK